MSPQKQNKTILWIAAALVIAVAVFALCYLFFAPQAANGAKTITIAVTDNQNTTTVYETTTDAQYLRQAMEDTKDLTFQGTEGQYGLMLDTINGLTADWEQDQAWWSIYVNDALANYGIDSQPIADGDVIQFQYCTQDNAE